MRYELDVIGSLKDDKASKNIFVAGFLLSLFILDIVIRSMKNYLRYYLRKAKKASEAKIILLEFFNDFLGESQRNVYLLIFLFNLSEFWGTIVTLACSCKFGSIETITSFFQQKYAGVDPRYLISVYFINY